MDPYMPGSYQFGVDTYARQLAMEARQANGTNAAGIASNTAALAALLPVVGSVAVPALALGASTTLTVTWPTAITQAYEPLPYLTAAQASLLGNLVIGGVVSKTTTQVQVVVRAPLLAVAAGATLRVVALKLAVT